MKKPQTMLYRDLSEVTDRLLEHLDFIRVTPRMILNCGLHTDYSSEYLKSQYPDAEIHSLDRPRSLVGKNNSYDFIFSNLMLPWVSDVGFALSEFKRVLKPEGLLLFTTLGPDTLKELRECFARVDQHQHVQSFIDMHDIGDALMQLFANPVMDMERLTVSYKIPDQLFQDLRSLDTKNVLIKRSKGLMGKNAWSRMLEYYRTFRNDNGGFPATIELIYGHAWGRLQKAQSAVNKEGEAVITVDDIIRTKSQS